METFVETDGEIIKGRKTPHDNKVKTGSLEEEEKILLVKCWITQLFGVWCFFTNRHHSSSSIKALLNSASALS